MNCAECNRELDADSEILEFGVCEPCYLAGLKETRNYDYKEENEGF